MDIKGRLEEHLKIEITEINKLKSGWAGEVYSFSTLDENTKKSSNFILKTYSPNQNGIESIKKEAKALQLLNNFDVKVPKLLSWDTKTDEFERPFIIMEKIDGNMFWDSYVYSQGDKKQELMKTFVELLFKTHSVDVREFKPDFSIKNKYALIDTELDEIKKLVDQIGVNELNNIYNWLLDKKEDVINLKPSILHRDYHPWNVIQNETGECYVIDWVWGIGDYRFDLAWTVTLMDRSGFHEFSEEVLKQYEFILGHEIENFEYFEVLASLRWLLNVTSSIKSGDNLRDEKIDEFKSFLQKPIKNTIEMFSQITHIEVKSNLC